VSKHYDITDWLDLIRGFSTPEMRIALESHREGCQECRETMAWAQRLQATALADSRSDVPAQVVRNAQAIFALRRLETIQVRPGLLARMIFDSFSQPSLQGVRSEQGSDTRHMIFEAEEYVIDLRLEHQRGLATVSMIGQIHRANSVAANITPMPVTLTSGQTVLASTLCNDFGEFAMEYLPKGSLCLQLGREEELAFEV
jgi:hypothetical protein